MKKLLAILIVTLSLNTSYAGIAMDVTGVLVSYNNETFKVRSLGKEKSYSLTLLDDETYSSLGKNIGKVISFPVNLKPKKTALK